MRKRLRFFLAAVMLALVFAACSAPSGDDGSRTVTDSVGRSVSLPREIDSISCVCPFSGPMIVLFGYGDQLTTGCKNMTRSALLNSICPGISDLTVAKNSGSLNAEAILEHGADVIFVDQGTYEDADQRSKLDAIGIPYVVVGYETLAEQLDAVAVIGAALGTEEEAARYIDWANSIMSRVEEGCRDIPDSEKPRIYHSVNEAVRTDYQGSICAEWIALTGAENVSLTSGGLTLEGDKAYTTLEQIYVWEPDLMICNEAGVDDYILSDAKWTGLKCVEEGRVYQIPIGTSRMGHPTSTETPLALLWLAELLYPDYFDIDFSQELQDYYAEFYDYQIDEETVDAILEGDEMRAAKTGSGME